MSNSWAAGGLIGFISGLVGGLLRVDEATRYSGSQLWGDAFFAGLDWEALARKRLAPPFAPCGM